MTPPPPDHLLDSLHQPGQKRSTDKEYWANFLQLCPGFQSLRNFSNGLVDLFLTLYSESHSADTATNATKKQNTKLLFPERCSNGFLEDKLTIRSPSLCCNVSNCILAGYNNRRMQAYNAADVNLTNIHFAIFWDVAFIYGVQTVLHTLLIPGHFPP
jgi:hypothetical protein